MTALIACSLVAVAVTIGIVASLLSQALQFFQKIPLTEFLFSTHWSPQTALRTDQIAAEGQFGVIPLFTGTLLISAIAMAIATPLGLASAVYLAEYATKRTRSWVKTPFLKILAGVPDGSFMAFSPPLTVAPFIRWTGEGIRHAGCLRIRAGGWF